MDDLKAFRETHHPCAPRETAALPPVMSLEQWAASRGLTTTADVQAHLHAGLRSAPQTKTYQRWNSRELQKLQTARDETHRLYEQALARGEIRSPASLNRRERLEITAAGHPDNPSVQAARRILARMRQEESAPARPLETAA